MKASFRGIRRPLPLRSISSAVRATCGGDKSSLVYQRSQPFRIAPCQHGRFFSSEATPLTTGTAAETTLDLQTRCNVFLESDVGTWDSTAWRSACRIFYSASRAQDSLALSTRLLHRLALERPQSSEAVYLLNQILKPLQTERVSTAIAASVHDCIQECIAKGWKADQSIYKKLIEIACRHENPVQAEQWLHGMWDEAAENSLLQPDRYLYTDIVQSWVRSGDSNYASSRIETLVRDLQRRYREDYDKSLKPTEACYAGWIVALQRSSQIPDAPEQAERLLMELWENAKQDDFYPSSVLYNAAIHAWARRGDAARAQKLLYHMCRAYLEGTNQYCLPDTGSFSTVILAWSKSGHRNAPHEAEKLLQQMQDFHQTTGLESVQPNTRTLTSVLDCWAKSDHKRLGALRAEAILRRMQKQYKAGNKHVKPNTVTFNTCMNAWARSGGGVMEAPEKVDALFRSMQEQYLAGNAGLKPCPISYMTRINAWERSGRPDSAERVQAVLDELIGLKDPSVVPTTLHYNRVILSWARRGNVIRAEALLQQMLDNHGRGALQSSPNLSSFNFVLAAWSKSGSDLAVQKAEETLMRMVELAESTDLSVRPDTASFNTILGCCAKVPGNYLKARSILDLQITRYNDGDERCKPDNFGYTSVLKSCATEPGSGKNQKRAFSMAMATFEQLELYDRPNNVTFGAMLKACSKLLPSTSPRRRKLVEWVFQECRRAGCVNNTVLHHLHAAATPDLYRELLDGHDRHSLPRHWTSNAVDADHRLNRTWRKSYEQK